MKKLSMKKGKHSMRQKPVINNAVWNNEEMLESLYVIRQPVYEM